jgi:hypothetical protein
MKTYPYQDGDRLIQLVEKRELDQLVERLAEARESHLAASARDVQTIQRQAILLERLADALKEIAWIKETGQRDYSWTGDTAFTALAAYESANLEPVANPIDEAVKRMEEVDSLLSTKLFLPGRKTLGEAMEDFRARLIAAAKGEQP